MKRIALLFSGQGSQYVGMGKKLYERDSAARSLFETASKALDLDMAELCFHAKPEQLNRTENTQPALMLCSLAWYYYFRSSTGLLPHFLAGHSLGELSALVAAEAIGVEDGLRLARARGLAMSRCAPEVKAGMHAVTRLEREVVESVCAATPGFGSEFVLANLNAQSQFVLSGSFAGMERAGEALKKAGGTIIPLKVSGPFHSPFMAEAATVFAEEMAKITVSRPKIPVIANVTALPHADPAQIAAALTLQITHPVLWSDSMKYLQRENIEVFLEAGPAEVLKKLTLINLRGAQAFSLDLNDDVPLIEQCFAHDIRAMKERPSVVGKCLAIAVCTQNHNWDEALYQKGVVEPYRQLQALQEKIEREGRAPVPEEMVQALDWLGQIFTTKGTPQDERAWRLTQIVETSGSGDVLGDYTFP